MNSKLSASIISLALLGSACASAETGEVPTCRLEAFQESDITEIDQTIEALSAKPRYPDSIPPLILKDDGIVDNELTDNARQEYRDNLGSKYGFSFLDTDAAMDVLDQSSPPETLLQLANDFFDPADVDVELAAKSQKIFFDQLSIGPVSFADLTEEVRFGSTIQMLIMANQEIPKELIEAVGLNKIVFVSEISDSQNFYGGLADYINGIYYIVYNSGTSAAEAFRHEFEHLISAAYLARYGCMVDQDPQVESLNQGYVYGLNDYPIEVISEDAYANGISRDQAVFWSIYGTTNSAEDRATATNTVLLTGTSLFEKPTGPLDRKRYVELRRIDELVPGVFDYRADFLGVFGG